MTSPAVLQCSDETADGYVGRGQGDVGVALKLGEEKATATGLVVFVSSASGNGACARKQTPAKH